MSAVQRIQRLSIEEYLAREREADIRHEYVDGEIFAMAGASREHILIAGNVHAALHGYLRGSPCRVLMTDMKVRINPANAFYYPDLLVSCTDMDAEPDSYYETEPRLIFEVLSRSTEARDRMEKRLNYQALESLKEYVLIAQNKIEVDIYRRLSSEWEHERCSVGAVIELRSIDFALPIADVYEAVPGIA